MKKLGMLIVVLIFAGTQFVMAQPQNPQPPQQPQQVSPVRDYIQKNVLPVVKQAQSKFIAALSPAEKEELTKIQEKLKDLRPGPMGAPGAGMGNRPMMQNHRGEMRNLMDQVKKIADAHPKAAEVYKEAIDANKAKWTKDIQAIREKNAMGYGRNGNNRNPFILDRLSDPAFGLMFNGNLFPMGMKPGMGPGMRPGGGRGMGNGNFGRNGAFNGQMGGRMGGNMGYCQTGMVRNFGSRGFYGHGMYNRQMQRRPGMMMRAMNPEVKKALLAYAQKNIFPELNKQREAFDKVLKNSEKKDIENVRKNIADLRAQRENNWKNRSNGQPRPGDSVRLAHRVQMEKNLLVLNEIVLNHFSELHASLKNLREDMPKWREEMHQIAFQNMKEGNFGRPMGSGYGRMMAQRGRMMGFHRNHKIMTPGMRFLLYDPAHPGEHFFALTTNTPTGENSK